eukprot:4070076-Amphidinium_carterae.1
MLKLFECFIPKSFGVLLRATRYSRGRCKGISSRGSACRAWPALVLTVLQKKTVSKGEPPRVRASHSGVIP